MRAKRPNQKKPKRLGRGSGSGHGKTSSKGHKGQRARSGAKIRPGFEGGQNPLYRRLPKRGFSRARFSSDYVILNLDSIAALEEKEVTPEILRARGQFKKVQAGLKVLGQGELKKAVVVKAHKFSKSAKEKIEKAGGQAILLESLEIKQKTTEA